MKFQFTNERILKIPIYLTVIYLMLTIVIYVFCPYDWPTKRPVLFYVLNILYIVAIVWGYHVGLKYDFRIKKFVLTEEKFQKFLNIVSLMAIVNFTMYLIYVFRSYGFDTLDFWGLAEQMAVGFKAPGLGYLKHVELVTKLDGSNVVGGKIYTLISLGWGFFKNVVTVLGVIYFKRLKIYGKIFTVAYMILIVLFYISIGTNIQFFHVILLVILPVILKLFDYVYHKTLTLKKAIQMIGIILAGFVVFAVYFGWMTESRSAVSGYEISEYTIGNVTPIEQESSTTQPIEQEDSTTQPIEDEAPVVIPTEPAPEPTLIERIGKKISNLWYSVSSYLTQGYYGMSQALELEWVPMYGVGNSMFLVNIISDNFYDIDQFTYQVRLEPYGWDSDVRWCTMYTWVANDVSFYGVILVMFALGMVFAMMFRDAIKEQDPFARASMFFYIILILFIPCNNQIAQTNENICAFLTLVFLWFIGGSINNTEAN